MEPLWSKGLLNIMVKFTGWVRHLLYAGESEMLHDLQEK